MAPQTLVQFGSRATAYAFAAELRRVVDLSATSSLRVHDTDRGVIVALPEWLAPYGGLDEIAQRFDGRLATGESLHALHEAIARADVRRRETAALLRSAHAVADEARAALEASVNARRKRNE